MTLAIRAVAPTTAQSGADGPSASLVTDYDAVVRQYGGGDFQGAMAALARWPLARVRAVRRLPSRPQDQDLRRVRAAVMLHSDVSMLVAAADQRLSREHVDAARAWIRALPDDVAPRFKERWHAYAVGPYLVQHDLRAATLAVREGIGAFPRSADLHLMQGTVLELTARGLTSDIRGVWMPNPRIEAPLQAAAVAYQRAIELDPSLLSVRLRLGWVYGVDNSSGHAREQLRIVADSATSRDLSYLAHLMLGGLAEQDGRAELAYEEYDRAHSSQGDAQTAHRALMRVSRMTGRVDRAERLFAEYAARTTWGEDPWWYFAMGLDSELSAWLHAQATQP